MKKPYLFFLSAFILLVILTSFSVYLKLHSKPTANIASSDDSSKDQVSLYEKQNNICFEKIIQKAKEAELQDNFSSIEFINKLEEFDLVSHNSYPLHETKYQAFIFACDKDLGRNNVLVLIETSNQGKARYLYGTSNFYLDFYSFKDINQDGHIELTVSSGTGGNCWTCLYYQLLQIKNGTVIDLTKELNKQGVSVVSELTDFNNDGIFELEVLDARWEFFWDLCHACSPGSRRIYVWEKDKFIDRSSDFKDYYLDRINTIKSNVKKDMVNKDMSAATSLMYVYGGAISALINYETIGLKDAGWDYFWDTTDTKNWPDLPGGWIEKYENLRNFLKNQYESGEQFSPKDE